MKKAKAISVKYILYDFIRFTSLPLFLLLRPKKLYLSQAAKKKIRGGALLVSNHTGFTDPIHLMVAIWYRRHHYIAAKEVFRSGFRRMLFEKIFYCIEIDRENFGFETFRTITEHLKAGELLVMFPEGKVNVEKQGIQSFKTGMGLMALRSNVPLIPIYVKRREHFFARLVVAVGEPVYMDSFSSGGTPTMEDINRATEYLYQQEKQLEQLCMANERSPKGEKNADRQEREL